MTLTLQKEQAIQTWFNRMESRPGIYEGLDEIDGESVTPRQRIHEMFLKRLYGQTIGLYFPYTPEFGDIRPINGIELTEQVLKDGLNQKLRFETSKGITGDLLFNWGSLVATFVPDGVEVKDLSDVYMYQLNQFHIFGISADPLFHLHIDFTVDMVRLEDSDGAVLGDMAAMNKQYIEMGVLHQKTGYMPTRPVTFKEIAEITGVTPSTLSDLKNGKKSLDNLTHSTFAILSQYGHVRNVDSMIYDALTKEDRMNDTIAAPQLKVETPMAKSFEYTMKTDVMHRVVVVLKDGNKFVIWAGRTREEADAEYLVVTKKFVNSHPTMTLQDGMMDGADPMATLPGIVLSKDMVSYIYVDKTNRGYHVEPL